MESNNLNKRSFGSDGERIAAKYLADKGYKILFNNFRVGKIGEIDIIAKYKEYICFIEVKTRASIKFGMPCEAVNKRKQEKIRLIAQMYISRYNLHNSNIRFDIVEIIGKRKNDIFEVESINFLQNAF